MHQKAKDSDNGMKDSTCNVKKKVLWYGKSTQRNKRLFVEKRG